MPVSLQLTEQPRSWKQFLGTAVCTGPVTVSRGQLWGGTGPRSVWGVSTRHVGRPGGVWAEYLWEVEDWLGGSGDSEAKLGLRFSSICV